jgi:hypothetical protein
MTQKRWRNPNGTNATHKLEIHKMIRYATQQSQNDALKGGGGIPAISLEKKLKLGRKEV